MESSRKNPGMMAKELFLLTILDCNDLHGYTVAEGHGFVKTFVDLLPVHTG